MKPIKFISLCSIIIFLAVNCYGQIEYPHGVAPGQKLNVAPATDTIWLLTNTQYDNAVIKAKTLKITEQQLDIQKQMTKNRDSVITQLNGKVFTLDTAYKHYTVMWAQCDSTLQKREIDIVHLKSSRRNYAIGFGIGGLILGFLLKAIL